MERIITTPFLVALAGTLIAALILNTCCFTIYNWFRGEVVAASKSPVGPQAAPSPISSLLDSSSDEDFAALGDDQIDEIINELQGLTREVSALEDKMKKDMLGIGQDFDQWMTQQGLTAADDSAAMKRLRMLEQLKANRLATRSKQVSASKPAENQASSTAIRNVEQHQAKRSRPQAIIPREMSSQNATPVAAVRSPNLPDENVVSTYENSSFTAKWRQHQKFGGRQPAYTKT